MGVFLLYYVYINRKVNMILRWSGAYAGSNIIVSNIKVHKKLNILLNVIKNTRR